MKNSPRNSFPFRNKRSKSQSVRPIPLGDTGKENKIGRYAWISSGRLTKIERGHPIGRNKSVDTEPVKHFAEFLIKKPYLQKHHQIYKIMNEKHPEVDPFDTELMCQTEKQLIAHYSAESAEMLSKQQLVLVHEEKKTTEIPVDGHLRTFGGKIPFFHSMIFHESDFSQLKTPPKKAPKRTGLEKKLQKESEDASAQIREVHFEHVTPEAIGRHRCEDDVMKPLILYKDSNKNRPELRAKSKTGKSTVQECMKKFFDPRVGISHVPADIGKYFPLELLRPERKKESNDPLMNLDFLVDEKFEKIPEVKLLDSKDDDVLFTKSKAPYSRSEIAEFRAFRSHWFEEKKKQKEKFEDEMEKRDLMIYEGFHSKSVFETYLKLLEEEEKRLQSGTHENVYKDKSIWEVAWEKAPKDYASIKIRRVFWWQFCEYVKLTTCLKDEAEQLIVKTIREMLMRRFEVLPSFFWFLVKNVPANFLENVFSLKLLEFVRLLVDANQAEFLLFFREVNMTNLYYLQVTASNLVEENFELIQKILHEPPEVPPFFI